MRLDIFPFYKKMVNSSKSHVLIGWDLPSPLGFVKLKTDGSFSGNPGKLLRDHNGNWIRGFSRNIGITNFSVAEMWGLRDGLLLARNLNIQKLLVEIDAKVVEDLLKSHNILTVNSHPYSALIYDCKYLLRRPISIMYTVKKTSARIFWPR